jgi:hypothetical protein
MLGDSRTVLDGTAPAAPGGGVVGAHQQAHTYLTDLADLHAWRDAIHAARGSTGMPSLHRTERTPGLPNAGS